MNKLNLILYFVFALSIAGCAATPKTEPVSPEALEAAVADAATLMREANKTQADLLAHDEHVSAMTYFRKARRGLDGGYEQDYILENAATAKVEFEKALANAGARSPNATRILQARRSALDAGLRNSDRLLVELADLDEDLRDETDDFARPLEPQEFAEFQKKYFALEVKSVQFRELNAVRQTIRKARGQDAEEQAPKTLRTARLDLGEAENLIAQSPRDAKIHGPSVETAVASATLLADTMAVILDAPGTPEDIALKIVYQNRELEKMSQNLGSLEQNLKSTQSSLMETEGALQQQNQALQQKSKTLEQQNKALQLSSTQVRFQRAMDEAVQQFSDDEASVYQQGSKLIFRLKKINFRSGTSTIPAASKPLLEKVNDIIRSVGAELVAVEGHTDSVGANDLNQRLSTARAVSVANYLASLRGGYKIGYIGYGESKPIASNETRAGRAINRRVDLVVTARP